MCIQRTSRQCTVLALFLAVQILFSGCAAPSTNHAQLPAPSAVEPAGQASPSAWDPAATSALVVGVLEWNDESLTRYPKEGRKDRALVEQLKARGVPAQNIVFVKDKAATLDKVRQEVAAAADRAGPGSTLILYYAGHGTRIADASVFFNYDIDVDHCAETGIALSEVTSILKERWKGQTLLLFADCCHSGGLTAVVKAFEGTSVRAAMVASADAEWESTGNWTFTESLIAALSGDGAADLNRDGTITLDEAGAYVRREMRWREEQIAGASRTSNFDPGFVLSRVDSSHQLARLDGPWQIGDYAEVRFDDSPRPVRIEAFEGGRYKVRTLGTVKRVTSVNPDRLLRPTAAAAAGEKVQSLWDGKWYPASVINVSQDAFYRVHYEGYESTWDEWLTPSRIRRADQ